MASTIIRTTYALDADTVTRLDRLARAWKLSRSAALRKLIRERELPKAPSVETQLAALDAYQAAARHITPAQAAKWEREVRLERRASTRRMLARFQSK
ncbi:MAG: CopG family transcriptional regulator [Terriglobales bacterium]